MVNPAVHVRQTEISATDGWSTLYNSRNYHVQRGAEMPDVGPRRRHQSYEVPLLRSAVVSGSAAVRGCHKP